MYGLVLFHLFIYLFYITASGSPYYTECIETKGNSGRAPRFILHQATKSPFAPFLSSLVSHINYHAKPLFVCMSVRTPSCSLSTFTSGSWCRRCCTCCGSPWHLLSVSSWRSAHAHPNLKWKGDTRLSAQHSEQDFRPLLQNECYYW